MPILRKEGMAVKDRKWIFLFYAVLAVLAMAGIGFSISLRNAALGFFFLVFLFFIMGIGFQTKKKWREEGKL